MRLTRARIAVLASATLLATGSAVGSASASGGYVGPGQANDFQTVQCVQHAINNSPTPYHILKEDGSFGPDTEGGIIAFQNYETSQGYYLKADGIVGPATAGPMSDWAVDWSQCYGVWPS